MTESSGGNRPYDPPIATTVLDAIRDFALQLDKTLSARRLYAPNSPAHKESTDALVQKCRFAAGNRGFTLDLTSTDLFCERQQVLSKAKKEEAFFFPLYRDGLRQLTFTPAVTEGELKSLLAVFEIKDKDLGATDDTVNMLWRADLKTIKHQAIDELDDIEGPAHDELERSIIAIARVIVQTKIEVSETVAQRNAQEIGRDYALIRSTFEGNLDALRITAEQLTQVRSDLGEGRVQTLVERFIEILLVTVWVPFKSIDPGLIAPILAQLIDGYWATREFERASVLLTHVNAASRQAPNPVSRQAMRFVLDRFLTNERLATIVSEFERGVITPSIAAAVFELPQDNQIWLPLLDALPRLADPEAKKVAIAALKKRLDANADLMMNVLASFDAARIRAALTLLDEKSEKAFGPAIIGLASHPDESIRLKALKAAASFGGPMALEVLWKAMESDPAKPVRLYAFRSISTTNLPGLATRLETLVTSPEFEARPAWEREKYVRLLATVAGPDAEPLFESWIPRRRLIWTAKDLETLEIALRGLGTTGDSGFEKVQAMRTMGGKAGEIARKVADAISRCEIGENTMMRERES